MNMATATHTQTPPLPLELAPAILSIEDCYLVALRCRLTGGITYSRRDISAEAIGAGEERRWETIRTVADRRELMAAQALRASIRRRIARVGTSTAYGLVVPASRARELADVIAAVRREVDAHNGAVQHARLEADALVARVSASDPHARQAITRDMAGYVESLIAAAEAGHREAIRTAASAIRRYIALFSATAQAEISALVTTARREARAISAGEQSTAPATAATARRVIRCASQPNGEV